MARAAKVATAAPSATNYPVLKDKAVVAAVQEYVAAKAEIEKLEAAQDERKALLVAAAAGAPTFFAGGHIVSLTEVRALPATSNVVITKEMVGQVIPGKKARKGYTIMKVQ